MQTLVTNDVWTHQSLLIFSLNELGTRKFRVINGYSVKLYLLSIEDLYGTE